MRGKIMADSNTLYIVNYFNTDIDVAVTDNNWNCCDAPKPGFVVGDIPSDGIGSMVYVRTDGHGCNGRQGQFQFAMNSTMLLNMDFDSGGGIEISDQPSTFAAYLSQNGNGTYTLVVGPTPHA
jgi:hypothetical protein